MSRNQTRKGGRKRSRQGNDTWAADAREPSTLANIAFEEYYKSNNIVAAEEWPVFMEALRRALPMALRIHTSSPHSNNIFNYLHQRLCHVFNTKSIPFIPEGKGLQCAVSRGDLKRSLEFKELKKIIAALNEGGYLTRQETVSMIPVVLLQVSSHHRVLDMCAAPGSKTSQILEVLISSSMEDGLVVANDVNASRLDILLHQTNRSAGSHPHLIVTNYDATQFPLLPCEEKFDRVLCDVMCSGDGTLRKSMDMWPRWNTLQGADVHYSQIKVLTRGMMLCKKGGIVVYSTCSLNPVEDEAVVSHCLAEAKGSFRLIDPTNLLQGFQTVPGQTKWSLLTKDLSTRLESFEEAKSSSDMQKGRGFRYHASMFPKTEQLNEQNIHYTRRVLPHLQDTGGFFVAVMECVEDYPISSTINKFNNNKSEIIKPISVELQGVVKNALGLSESFPINQILVRNETAREQKMYFANKAVCNFFPKLGSRVVHVGSKVFESFSKYSNDKLRFCTEGVSTLVPLLPSLFFVDITPEILLKFSHGKVEESLLGPIPSCHSFILRCKMFLVGDIHIPAEKSWANQISAKVAEWQLTLAKITLGQAIVEPDTETNTEIEANDEEKEVDEENTKENVEVVQKEEENA